MTQPSRIFSLALFAATSLLLPGRATAQSGTVTDDAFVSSNVATQLFNLKGQGISLIVAGSTATVGSTQVGTTTTYIKFQLTSSLPPNVAATNVQKATLKLFLSPLTVPTGAIDIYPVTGSWTESTLSTSSAPTLAATPIASDVTLGMANTFLVVDVTQLVQDWLNGTANGGFANDGIALVAHTGSSYAVFDSKESVVTSHEPRLEIALANTGAQGPQGSQGPAGATGATGATGGTGAPGSAATLQVGTTMTVPAGTPASALNGGTPNAAVLNFLIPQGPIGMTGPQGPVGINNRNMWGMGNSYNPNDAVSYNNSFWLATAVDNGAQPPSGNPNWQLLAAGINNRGAWSASNSYNVNDAVTDAGSYWLALAPTSGTSTPSTSCEPSLQLPCSTDWQQLAAQGAIGAQGANGATGPAGQSVASSLEPSGPNCAFGGSKFSAANGTTYACNGATGATGPQGLAGPSGSGAGGSGFAGLQEFTQTDTFTVPTGVTGILVELWGAGSG
ncbi:MAG TPA: DNRLRE domain-containing protein, partial [Candidatus Acidoferrum sp.]